MQLFSFVNVVIETIIALFYFYCIFEVKKRRAVKNYIFPVLLVGISIFTGILQLPTHVNLFIAFILYCILVFAIFMGSGKNKLFAVAIYLVLIFFADILAVVLISAYGISYQMVGSDNITYIVGAMLSDFIRLWLAAYVSKILSRKVQNLPISYWIFLVLCPVISIACLLIFDFYLMQAREVNEVLIFLFPAGILYINLMLFRFFEAFSDKIRLKVMEQLAVQEQENYKVLQQNEEELRALRHDIKNHAMVLSEYLEHGNTETALSHLRELEKTFVRISSVVYTSNPAMDAALNIGARKAQAEGIVYKVQIQGAGEIQLDSVDLCTFLSNAIDNAIEGCAGCEEKYIYIEIIFSDKQTKIHIENSTCRPNKKTGFFTTKIDKKNHGFGMRNIKNVVNKYHGFLEYEIKDHVFNLDIFFNI